MHSTGDLRRWGRAQGVSPQVTLRVVGNPDRLLLGHDRRPMPRPRVRGAHRHHHRRIPAHDSLQDRRANSLRPRDGGVAGGGRRGHGASLRSFGEGLGRAFQIRDDYLGIWGDEATLGKATGNDIRRRKKVLSRRIRVGTRRRRGPERPATHLLQTELAEDDVQRVLAILDEVGARESSQEITESAANRAMEALNAVEMPAWARKEAEELVDFLARREY